MCWKLNQLFSSLSVTFWFSSQIILLTKESYWQARTSQWFCGAFMIRSLLLPWSQGPQSLQDLLAQVQNMPLRVVGIMINLWMALSLGHEVSTRAMRILLKMYNSARRGNWLDHCHGLNYCYFMIYVTQLSMQDVSFFSKIYYLKFILCHL